MVYKKTKGYAGGGMVKKTKGYAMGGMAKKTKGYAAGGMTKGTKGYAKGGVARKAGSKLGEYAKTTLASKIKKRENNLNKGKYGKSKVQPRNPIKPGSGSKKNMRK